MLDTDNELLEQKIENNYRELNATLENSRRKRKAVLIAISSLCVSFFLSGGFGNYYFGVIPMPKEVMYLVSFVLFVLFFGLLTYFYLQGGIFLSDQFDLNEEERTSALRRLWNTQEELSENSELHDSFVNLKNYVTEAFSGNLSKLTSEISASVKAEAGAAIWEEIKSSGSRQARLDSTIESLQSEFDDSRRRLLSEINALSKRGSVNLALGVATTSAAIVMLGTFAFDVTRLKPQDGLNVDNPETLLITLALLFIPKISLAVFMQVFAFFFLRLYKSGLSDIKYFQNELTNNEVKYLGVQVALIDCDNQALEIVIKNLIGTERNHVLTQGQTTIELEKHKLEHNSSSEIVKILPKLIGRKTI
ncbi:hypothetical protein C4J85_2813 [Pseudomonas sp. R4-34-07]|uniref:hypothetical protein n=1 Tax=Pseudomonas sp. R4-34-07 TaxID=658642 RepID=UPI000F57448E|nr:hypothetical protein [Pseudomonas sp. R4-34-07]AZF53298.1 hypothetical protein C4J85_2813 [Pseudomonas sp. R4-34-07]